MINQPKTIHGWAMYDWANSVYNLLITTTFFPVYYLVATTAFFKGELVRFFGVEIINSVLYDYAVSFAYLLVFLWTPLLCALADRYNQKLLFLRIFSTLGSVSCACLYFFTGENVGLGILSFVCATIGFAGSMVFYNAFLPEVATPDRQDAVSARGYIYGYIGSVLVQIIGFVLLLTKPFGISDGEAIRLTFFIVGVWWFGFAQYSFQVLKRLPNPSRGSFTPTSHSLFSIYQSLLVLGRKMMSTHTIAPFLVSFFFYSMGVQTVMIVAINFGQKVLHIPSTNLILIAVFIQIVAVLGSYLTSKLASQIGNIQTIVLILLLWIGVCVLAYFIDTALAFYVLAVLVGFVMGAIQSLSRSTYSKLMPETQDTTSYFSFYDMVEKLTIVLGIFIFGFIESLTHNMRYSVLSLIVFFVLGWLFLLPILLKKKQVTSPS